MGWRIVKQPNGLLARFSDVVDDFTDYNLTEAEAVELCREHMGRRDAEEKVRAGVEDWKPWTRGVKGSGLDRWNDCLDTIKNAKGENHPFLLGVAEADSDLTTHFEGDDLEAYDAGRACVRED